MLRDLPCAYHQGQSITNFCDEQKCLMPLCPKCLPIHTQEHKKNKTYGSFQPIDDVIDKANKTIKQKIETYKKLSSNNQKTTQNNSDLNKILNKKIKEAKDRILFEIDSFFNALESKCQKMCQELSMKKNSSLKNESLDIEKKIHQQEEYLEGLFKKDKCLMSLIRALKEDKEDIENGIGSAPSLNKLNSKNDVQDTNGILLKKIQLQVDLEKLTKITDSLSGYAKLIYNQTKKQVTFDDNSISNKSISSSADSRHSPETKQKKNKLLQSPTKEIKKKESKKKGNEIYSKKEDIEESIDKEEDQESNKNDDEETSSNIQVAKRDSDELYLINDPDIIKIRQRREERRIRAELREIGKFNPMSEQNVTNNKQKKVSIDDKKNVEIKEPSSSNFISYERPAKDDLKKFAKPQEQEFLDMVQKKSQQMQSEFEKQQNDIYVNAMSYQIPTTHQMSYQPKHFAEQQQQSMTHLSSPQMPSLQNKSLSQPNPELYQAQSSSNLQQQYQAQQQYGQRPPLADKYQQNNFRQQSPHYAYEKQNYTPYSQSLQQFGSPNRSINNSFKYDQANNSHSLQNLQQWPNRY